MGEGRTSKMMLQFAFRFVRYVEGSEVIVALNSGCCNDCFLNLEVLWPSANWNYDKR